MIKLEILFPVEVLPPIHFGQCKLNYCKYCLDPSANSTHTFEEKYYAIILTAAFPKVKRNKPSDQSLFTSVNPCFLLAQYAGLPSTLKINEYSPLQSYTKKILVYPSLDHCLSWLGQSNHGCCCKGLVYDAWWIMFKGGLVNLGIAEYLFESSAFPQIFNQEFFVLCLPVCYLVIHLLDLLGKKTWNYDSVLRIIWVKCTLQFLCYG